MIMRHGQDYSDVAEWYAADGKKMKNNRENEWIVHHYWKNKIRVVFVGKAEENVYFTK